MQVGLRSIPVRCLALDYAAEACVKLLPEDEFAAYKARVEEGKPVANKLNKMFWWLQPAAIPALGSNGMENTAPLPPHGGGGRRPRSLSQGGGTLMMLGMEACQATHTQELSTAFLSMSDAIHSPMVSSSWPTRSNNELGSLGLQRAVTRGWVSRAPWVGPILGGSCRFRTIFSNRA